MDTKNMIESASTWLTTNGLSFVISLLVFCLIMIVGKILIGRICNGLKASMVKSGKISELLQNFIINVMSKVMWLVTIMIGLQQMGINLAPLIAGLGVTGFIVGFAFQETLGNLAAGFMIALNQPFKTGDFIEGGGVTGVVRDMNMMCVMLTTGDNKKVTIPNNAMWGNSITNYSALETRRVDLIVGVSYGTDLGKARAVLEDVVSKHELVLADPKPVIEVVAMADSSVNFVVRPWVKTADYWAVYWAMNRQIKDRFDAEDIEIPFPQMDVHHYNLPQASAPQIAG